MEEHTAKSFARKHANYPFEIITTSITNLIRYFENLHISHYGYRANNRIIHSALNHTLSLCPQ